MAQTKALAGTITEMHCSIAGEMSTTFPKCIRVNSGEQRCSPQLLSLSFKIVVEKYEKMLSQSRKMMD